MNRASAAAGSLVFFIAAPGLVCGVVPRLISGWEVEGAFGHWVPLRVLGIGLIAAGIAFLVQAFARFVHEGLGTPAPIAAPHRLVVGGTYRYVRNPMYLAVLSVNLGQALLFGKIALGVWAAVVLFANFLFVRGFEEPSLEEKFGPDFESYRQAVPGWLPRLTPWTPPVRSLEA